uniref:Uncharacterized protein n=1 Tax=Lepeophtheirus salmonis TaxID=72036 RepID=A0A0K2VHK5_LEPSM
MLIPKELRTNKNTTLISIYGSSCNNNQ